jgi:isopenicillin N synthase-like dioxygenase
MTHISQIQYRDPEAPQKFATSLKETGFAVITHHTIRSKLLDEVYEEWTRFFKSSAKVQYTFNPQDQSGYFPFQSENAKDSPIKDLKEFFHLYPQTPLPSGIGPSTFELRAQLIELATELLGWLQKTTPDQVKADFSIPLPQMIAASESTLFRILHYPPLIGKIEPGAVRAAAHEDINLITLLPAATASGLEVKDTEGKWHRVASDPGSIIINSGDMLQLASQGYYQSTTHQVVNPEGSAAQTSRYSMPLFLHPRSEVMLSSTLSAGDYLHQRLRELGLKT